MQIELTSQTTTPGNASPKVTAVTEYVSKWDSEGSLLSFGDPIDRRRYICVAERSTGISFSDHQKWFKDRKQLVGSTSAILGLFLSRFAGLDGTAIQPTVYCKPMQYG